jgi:hypothetical protein
MTLKYSHFPTTKTRNSQNQRGRWFWFMCQSCHHQWVGWCSTRRCPECKSMPVRQVRSATNEETGSKRLVKKSDPSVEE